MKLALTILIVPVLDSSEFQACCRSLALGGTDAQNSRSVFSCRCAPWCESEGGLSASSMSKVPVRSGCRARRGDGVLKAELLPRQLPRSTGFCWFRGTGQLGRAAGPSKLQDRNHCLSSACGHQVTSLPFLNTLHLQCHPIYAFTCFHRREGACSSSAALSFPSTSRTNGMLRSDATSSTFTGLVRVSTIRPFDSNMLTSMTCR